VAEGLRIRADVDGVPGVFHALAAASTLPSEDAVRRLVTVTLAGLRPPTLTRARRLIVVCLRVGEPYRRRGPLSSGRMSAAKPFIVRAPRSATPGLWCCGHFLTAALPRSLPGPQVLLPVVALGHTHGRTHADSARPFH